MSKLNHRLVEHRKIYGNWQVQSPEGILMFRCEEKKARWYLTRNLAEPISENVIRLKFKPQGLGNHNKGYGLSEMVNRCVNCGTDKFLTRHHVVPYEYRKHFPIDIKSHNFYDVLSMCVTCHDAYERKANVLKCELANKHVAPVGGIISKRDDLKVLKYATTISKGAVGIPQFRIDEMYNYISEYLGRECNVADIKRLAEIKQQILLESHGEMVIRQVDSIKDFVQIWRKHFVENNDLNYLPSNWSIENNNIENEK